ncbi:DUF2934 domain-containing protein, partial [Pseudomonas aeruginosa]
SEGCPDGQAERHWAMARQLAEAEAAPAAPNKTPRRAQAAQATPALVQAPAAPPRPPRRARPAAQRAILLLARAALQAERLLIETRHALRVGDVRQHSAGEPVAYTCQSSRSPDSNIRLSPLSGSSKRSPLASSLSGRR